MNKRNYKAAGKKMTQTRENEFARLAGPLSDRIANAKRCGHPVGPYSLNKPSLRREKKAEQKYQQGTSMKIGSFESQVFKRLAAIDVYYEQHHERSILSGERR